MDLEEVLLLVVVRGIEDEREAVLVLVLVDREWNLEMSVKWVDAFLSPSVPFYSALFGYYRGR